ncbi:hypothetical protein ACJX0J_031487, partial [Zea mays]
MAEWELGIFTYSFYPVTDTICFKLYDIFTTLTCFCLMAVLNLFIYFAFHNLIQIPKFHYFTFHNNLPDNLDIKPDNLLLDKNGHMKLEDEPMGDDNMRESMDIDSSFFSYFEFMFMQAFSTVGTPDYIAPENNVYIINLAFLADVVRLVQAV